MEHEHGRVTYFCGTVNEVTVNLPSFEQAHQLRDIAPEFHGTQQLRERIAGVLVPALQVKRT